MNWGGKVGNTSYSASCYWSDTNNGANYMGPMIARDTWVRLEVPAALLGIEGKNIVAFSVSVDKNRDNLSVDRIGKCWGGSGDVVPPAVTLTQVELAGRVEDFEGLASFTVDAVPVTPDANGNWKATVSVGATPRQVPLEAIDTEGNKTQRNVVVGK